MRLQYVDVKIFVFLSIIFLVAAGMAAETAGGDDMEKLIVIREGFKDGLDDFVLGEIHRFLEQRPESSARFEVSLIAGIIERRHGRYSRAEKFLRKASKSPSKEIAAQAMYELARIAWKRKRYDVAEERFGRAAALAPSKDIRIQSGFWMAVSGYHAGHYQAAVERFTRILPGVSGKLAARARLFRAMSHLALEQRDAAFDDLEALFAGGDDAWRKKAARLAWKAAEQAKDPARADLWACRLCRLEPTSENFARRAEIFMKTGRYGRAHACFAEALARKIPDSESERIAFRERLSLARMLRSQGLAGWPPLVAFVTAHPGSEFTPGILEELAASADATLPPPEILTYLFRDDAPELAPFARQIAELYMKARAPEDAMHWLTLHLAATGRLEDTDRAMMIQLLQLTGDPEKALQELNEFQPETAKGDTAETALIRANLLFMASDYAAAAPLYQQWLIEHPGSKNRDKYLFWLGECYFRMKEWRMAAKVFRQVVSGELASSYRETALRRLFLCHYNARDWPRAVETARRYAREYADAPFYGEMLFYGGLARANTGDYNGALEAFSLALDNTVDAQRIEQIKSAIRIVENRNNAPAAGTPPAAGTSTATAPSLVPGEPGLE